MSTRKPGLQGKWSYVVNSLQEITESYERASSRISMFEDRRMRIEAVSDAVSPGSSVLDLGSGPGTMSRLVLAAGGHPVLLDASRAMLKASGFKDTVQGTFEHLPFRQGAFDGAVSGFALRDAYDLLAALAEVSLSLRPGGRFAMCDLGKPDGALPALIVAYYLRVAPNLIGLASAGRVGLRYGSI
ncbi:MAG TPA: methyltransferase domain-containing protein, partial [Nitrososphaerales archaeon]|nr:methyltransferase domain-containing protein [Nitrososphaerales archaeon]